VQTRLLRLRDGLPATEARVATTLLADYPVAGLQSVVALAAASAASPPTVLRLVRKLGFTGYPGFRAALAREASARLFTPLNRHDQPDAGDRPSSALARAESSLVRGIRDSIAALDVAELDRLVDDLSDTGRPVVVAGGQFSRSIAGYLASCLQLLRPDVTPVEPSSAERIRSLLDVGATTLAIVFDYRPYQADTVHYGAQLAGRGASVRLFTDPHLSPLARHADAVFRTSVEGGSNYEILTPALALVETVVAFVTDRLGAPGEERLGLFAGLQDEDNARNRRRAP
jgi:DNA-binding MurR/RpiR family transcriptional regulator